MKNKRLKRVENAIINIVLKDSLMGYILTRFPITIKDDLKTAATDGKEIMIGKDFLDTLTNNDLEFILLHELLHIILKHLNRQGDRNRMRFNVACDIVINGILYLHGYLVDKLTPLTGSMFKIKSYSKTAEQVYDMLPITTTEYNLLDCHDLWSNIDDEDVIDIEDIIKQGIKEGHTSSMLRNIGGFDFNSSSKNNWKVILRDILNKSIDDYSFNKIDNRYQDVLLPSFVNENETLESVWLLIDSSGSMYEDDLKTAYNEVLSIVRGFSKFKIDVSFFTIEVTRPKEVNSFLKLQKELENNKLSGGTCFYSIFDSLNKHYKGKLPKAIIIITDGYASFPNKSATKNIPVFWVINSNVKPPFGHLIKF